MTIFNDEEERKRRREAEEYERNEKYGSSGAWPWDEPQYDRPESPKPKKRKINWHMAILIAAIILLIAVLIALAVKIDGTISAVSQTLTSAAGQLYQQLTAVAP